MYPKPQSWRVPGFKSSLCVLPNTHKRGGARKTPPPAILSGLTRERTTENHKAPRGHNGLGGRRASNSLRPAAPSGSPANTCRFTQGERAA